MHTYYRPGAHILHMPLLLCMIMPVFKGQCVRSVRPMRKYSSTDAFASLLPLGVITPRVKSKCKCVVEHMRNHLVTYILHMPLLLSMIVPVFKGA